MSLFLNRNVEYFLKIVSSGSFKEAARLLNLSQPALSISIKNFEDSIGFALFAREKKNATLTPKGLELFETLRRVQKNVTEETNAVLTGQSIQRLRIGAIPWYAEGELLPAMRKTQLTLHDRAQYFIRPAGILHEAVTRGWIDFAFANYPEKPPGVMSHPLQKDPAVIAGLKSRFKHIEQAKSYEDLQDEPWIYGEGRGLNWTESIEWNKSGFVISDVHTLRMLILGGYGIYEFQLSYFSMEEQKKLAYTKFPSRFKNNRIYAMWSADLEKSKLETLHSLLRVLK